MESDTVTMLETARCTGCYACANACPVDAIAMVADPEGFPRPAIDHERCIACGGCARACPVLTPPRFVGPEIQEVYAAWSLDETVRYESTSGGIFSELALEWLSRGGVLCGAQYGEDHHIEHIVVRSRDGLSRIRQSKYAQSDVGDCYRQIRRLLREGVPVLFCGSPCQCAGLMAFLGDRPKELLIVNFVCRGTNSPKAYKAFLRWLEGRYGAKVSRVWFKNKAHGWNRFSTRVEFEDGRVYLKDRYHDLFIRGYIEQNLYMRECCHACEFRDFSKVSDVTLADFWGVKLIDETRDTDAGTSLVIINTERGRELFDSVKPRLFWERKSMADAFPGNICIIDSPMPNPKRSYFLSHLDDKSFGELCAECFDEPPFVIKLAREARGRVGMVLRAFGLR